VHCTLTNRPAVWHGLVDIFSSLAFSDPNSVDISSLIDGRLCYCTLAPVQASVNNVLAALQLADRVKHFVAEANVLMQLRIRPTLAFPFALACRFKDGHPVDDADGKTSKSDNQIDPAKDNDARLLIPGGPAATANNDRCENQVQEVEAEYCRHDRKHGERLELAL